ncbi:hypothetical protein LCGC14_1461380 [marine sediment metagenome]|uniref:Uncharacterized protein n=1 Tax=marine sediment metagenome TaxID=412755 RepID=A0A0F9MH04_9ZZZZ
MPKTFVPIHKFGKDHWSTFAYIDTRIMDYKGEPDRNHMRTDAKRHPGLTHDFSDLPDKEYPTILKGGVELSNHDDWDCLEDCQEAGLLEIHGTGIYPVYILTDSGRQVASQLRDFKSNGGNYADFEVKGYRLEEF